MTKIQRSFTYEIPNLMIDDAWLASIYSQMLSIVEAEFPQQVSGLPDESPQESWDAVEVAFMARMTLGMRGLRLLIPQRIDFDAWNIVRSLLEHAITFAWIAAAPKERFPVFLRADYQKRLDRDKEERKKGRPGVLNDEERSAFKQVVRTVKGNKPGLARMSSKADEHWIERFGNEILETRPFRQLYDEVYDAYSWYSHPSIVGLQQTWSIGGGAARIDLHQPARAERTPFSMAPFLYGAAIMVSSLHSGRPEKQLVKSTLMECAEIHAAKHEGRLTTTQTSEGSFSHYVSPPTPES